MIKIGLRLRGYIILANILIYVFFLFDVSYCNNIISNTNKNAINKDSLKVSIQFIDSLNNQPISYLAMDLYADSISAAKFICSVLLDRNGRIEVVVPDSVSSVIFFPLSREFFPVTLKFVKSSSKELNLGKQRLSRLQTLNEFKVLADSSRDSKFVKIYKVHKLSTHEAPVFSNYLKTIPEITVENNSLVYIGNKKIIYYLNRSKSEEEIIKNLPLSIIDKLEVISNPSILRVAENNSVVINVVTKSKNTSMGSSNSISGAILNELAGIYIQPYYMNKDLLVSFNANLYSNRSRSSERSSWQPTTFQNTFSLVSAGKGRVVPLFLNLFVQKMLSQKFQISLSVGHSDIHSLMNKDLRTTLAIKIDSLQRTVDIVRNKKREVLDNLNIELAFTGFKSKFFINSGFVMSNVVSSLRDDIFSESSSMVESIIESSSKDYFSQISVEKKLSKIITQRFGLVYNIRDSNSEVAYKNISKDIFFLTDSKNRDFTLSFNSYLDVYPKWIDFSVGCRIDKGRSFNGDTLYFSSWIFLPVVYISKSFKKLGDFNFDASRTVSVPNQNHLNPGYTVTNHMNIIYGSSRISREILDRIDLTHRLDFVLKFPISLRTNVFYSRTGSMISAGGYRYNEITRVFYRKQGNIGDYKNWGIGANVSKHFSKSTQVKIYAGLSVKQYFLLDSVYQTANIFNFGASWIFNLTKNLTISTNLSYRKRNIEAYKSIRSYPYTSLELSGNILKDKLFFSLLWDNIFNFNGIVNTEYRSFFVNRSEKVNSYDQTISFAFTYLLGKVIDRSTSMKSTIDKVNIKAY